MEQPANFGDKGGLHGMGIDTVAEILQIGPEAFYRNPPGGIVAHQNAYIHLVCHALGAETLKILTDGCV